MNPKHPSNNIETTRVIHKDIFTKVMGKMPKDEALYELADFFKIFGDSTRIKILYALFSSEMCVQDLAELLKMNQSAISHQLRILKQTGLVKYRKDGKYVFYSLDDDHVTQIIAQGVAHLSEEKS
jgi:ArsR family transcriptional regulator